MPKDKSDNTDNPKPLSHNIKVQIYGYCDDCGFYQKPCENRNRCSNYLLTILN